MRQRSVDFESGPSAPAAGRQAKPSPQTLGVARDRFEELECLRHSCPSYPEARVDVGGHNPLSSPVKPDGGMVLPWEE